MLNKLLIVTALIVFGAAMYLAGLSSPESVRTEVQQWLSESSDGATTKVKE